MAVCGFVKPDGTRCKAQPMRGEGWCYSHHPSLAKARSTNGRRGGRRGGRGRGSNDIAAIKKELKELVGLVRSGGIERADAAVAGQLLNIVLRALTLERDIREQEELTERIAVLEERGENRSENRVRSG